ncbi:MAG: hypothetical protein JWO41_148 [Candidatus Saccharibacteria bacterium]|nr:hypothetical protein [Candidatus Saccharibacteria bacterium]
MKQRLVPIILSLTLLFSQATVFATGSLSDDQKKVFQQGIWEFDVNDNSSCSSGTGTLVALAGNDNEEKIYNFFISKTLTPIQAAAIDGNFGQESTWNPNDGGGYLAQWGGGRLTNLEKFAAAAGKPVTDLQTQLEFVWHELTTEPVYEKVLANLKAATTIEDATNQFMGPDILSDGHSRGGGYENPGNPELQKRINYAKSALAKYGGGAAASAGPVLAAITGGSCSGITGDGQNTKFIDGFTFFSQCDPSWGKNNYGDATICAAGCGPSSMAMIVTNLTGQVVTPATIAAYADSHSLYYYDAAGNGQGSKWEIAPAIAQQYSLKSVAVGADIAKISAILKAGGLVAAPGDGADPYTTSGHYIVIRAVTADGKWKVADPFHDDANTKEWDPQQLVQQMHGGGVYGITK